MTNSQFEQAESIKVEHHYIIERIAATSNETFLTINRGDACYDECKKILSATLENRLIDLEKEFKEL